MEKDRDESPRPASSHMLGQPLDALSVAEFIERIALLRAEILRLEAAMQKKQAANAAADTVIRIADKRNFVGRRERNSFGQRAQDGRLYQSSALLSPVMAISRSAASTKGSTRHCRRS
jgi:uncharacterized small protein (DUF1192 family)